SYSPFTFGVNREIELEQGYSHLDYTEGFKQLKLTMASMDSAIPTLFKQYGELCTQGGVTFLDFGIDVEFGDCIDGLVLVDTHKLTAKKRSRYLDCHRPELQLGDEIK
ncbi:GNAT family N-acetyltransferase, partial [Shewanella sp. 0m-11]